MGKELSTKADMALSDLTTGGLLSDEQNDQFIRTLIDTPTLFNEVRVVPMNAPTGKINKIGFGSRILKPAVQTAGSRSLAIGDRSKATPSQVTLATKEVIAEIRLPYEVLEDNIERANMEGTIISLIAERASLDLEELLIQGDTTSADTYLALMNGVLALTTSNVVDAAAGTVDAGVFNSVIKALPTRFRRNKSTMRIYSSMDIEQDYRLKLSTRGTTLGDDILTGTRDVPVFGVPLRGAALMPDANMIFTNPQNIIFGMQRNMRMETDKDITAREVIIVLTARVATAIEEETGVVKVTNLAEVA